MIPAWIESRPGDPGEPTSSNLFHVAPRHDAGCPFIQGLRESSQPDPIPLRPNDLAQTGSETTHELISGVAPAAPAIPVSAFARGDAELWSYIGANPSGANDANPNGAGMRLGCSPDDRRQSEPANARAEVLGAGRRQVVVGLGQRAGVPDPSLSSPRLAPGSPAFSAYIDEQRAALAPNSPQRRHPHRRRLVASPPAAGPPLRARRRLAIALRAGDAFASIVAS